MKTLSVWTATLVSLAIFGLTAYASPAGCPAHLPAGTIIRILLTPTSGFKLEATASLPIEGGQKQVELQIIPNPKGNGWDISSSSQEASSHVGLDTQLAGGSNP